MDSTASAPLVCYQGITTILQIDLQVEKNLPPLARSIMLSGSLIYPRGGLGLQPPLLLCSLGVEAPSSEGFPSRLHPALSTFPDTVQFAARFLQLLNVATQLLTQHTLPYPAPAPGRGTSHPCRPGPGGMPPPLEAAGGAGPGAGQGVGAFRCRAGLQRRELRPCRGGRRRMFQDTSHPLGPPATFSTGKKAWHVGQKSGSALQPAS